jgi:hypothetical protein
VVAPDELPPGTVTQPGRELGRTHDVGEEHRDQKPSSIPLAPPSGACQGRRGLRRCRSRVARAFVTGHRVAGPRGCAWGHLRPSVRQRAGRWRARWPQHGAAFGGSLRHSTKVAGKGRWSQPDSETETAVVWLAQSHPGRSGRAACREARPLADSTLP